MCRATAYDDPLDYGAAGVTGLVGSSEDLDVEMLAPGISLPIHIVAEARTAVFDAALQHGPTGGEQTA